MERQKTLYKKAVNSMLVANIAFLLIAFAMKIIGQTTLKEPLKEWKLPDSYVANQSLHSLGIAARVSSGQRVVDIDVLKKNPVEETVESPAILYSAEELDILYRIVEAEAEGEDEDGKLLVANVVLNRKASKEFPDTIQEVVYQKNGKEVQFSPVGNGRIDKVTISEATKRAVERALRGEDLSQGALYFAARKYADPEKMKWFDTQLIFLFKHGGHEFFK